MGKPKVPEIPPIPPAAKISDPAVMEAGAEAIRRKSRQRGYRSTILASKMMDDQTKSSMQPGTQETFGA